MISDFGFGVGLWPTLRTVACGRFIASSFRGDLIRLSSRRRVRNSEFGIFPHLYTCHSGGVAGIQNSKFKIQNSGAAVVS